MIKPNRKPKRRRKFSKVTIDVTGIPVRKGPVVRDFSDAYADCLKENGILDPVMVVMPHWVQWVVMPDPDGLLYTGRFSASDGEPCMLSILFPGVTTDDDAPLLPDEIFVITQMLDRVEGNSGEVYGRFLVTVVHDDESEGRCEITGWRRNLDGTISRFTHAEPLVD